MRTAAVSPRMRLAGWPLTALCTAVMLASASAKLFAPPEVLEPASRVFGFPMQSLQWLAALEVGCALLYAWPRTALLGAVVLTGYLGGAVATHARLGEPAMLFPVALGVCAWMGLYLREPRLRALAPIVQA